MHVQLQEALALNSLMRIGDRDGKNSDPGWKKIGSGINTPDQQHCVKTWQKLFNLKKTIMLVPTWSTNLQEAGQAEKHEERIPVAELCRRRQAA
jgi:hypothetical protein